MSPTGPADDLEARVRRYYRTVSRYIDREHVHEDSRAFWRRMARTADDAGVLELGCGTGRITSVLAEGARPVVGVDLSPEMLERARARLAPRPGVHLLRADMRRLPLAGDFGLVTAASDPFAHLERDEDRERSLCEAARVLAADGRFVLELHWLDPDHLAAAGRPGGFERTRSLGPDGEELRIRETWHCDEETRRCTARYEYVRGGRVVDEASFRARLWSVDEVRRRLAGAGLRVRSLWGDFDRTPFDPASSARLLVEAEPRRPGP